MAAAFAKYRRFEEGVQLTAEQGEEGLNLVVPALSRDPYVAARIVGKGR
jgi:hypothetical protein